MYTKIRILFFLSVLTYIYSLPSYSDPAVNDKFRYPFYGGLTGGYGSTTWGELVPQNANVAMSLSTPTSVSEGGFAWGLFGGYEFIPQFALEASYMHYQAARLYFDPMSLFSFDYDGRTELTSNIETVSLMAKIM